MVDKKYLLLLFVGISYQQYSHEETDWITPWLPSSKGLCANDGQETFEEGNLTRFRRFAFTHYH